MTRDLAVLVPSRGRPKNVARLIDAMADTCQGDTRLLVGLDRDDPYLNEYYLGDRSAGSLTIDYFIAGGLRYVVAWINRLASLCAHTYRFLGTLGDDNVPRTAGWDVRVCESLERNVFCFGDDLHPGRQAGVLPCHVFMRSGVVRALGYMGPPSLQHMYVDNVWGEWGRATAIEFLPDVVMEHLHPSAEKCEQDESYTATTGLLRRDAAAFNAYCADGLAADIENLRSQA